MSRDYLTIGSTPPEETCIGVGQPGARTETLIYARQLKREFPKGDFRIKAFEHDFGTYHEAVAWFDEDLGNQEEREAAFAAEGGCAGEWDDNARVELFKAFGASYFTNKGQQPPTPQMIAAYDSEREQMMRELESKGK